MTTKTYRWDGPADWLLDKLDRGEISADETVRDLIRSLDGDTLQDLYQEDMDKDGYFQPIETTEPQDERDE